MIAIGIGSFHCSAHWCPPCRQFTPRLARIFDDMPTQLHGKLAIVFVSLDNDQSMFDEYFDEMPWMAVPFAGRVERRHVDVPDGTNRPRFRSTAGNTRGRDARHRHHPVVGRFLCTRREDHRRRRRRAARRQRRSARPMDTRQGLVLVTSSSARRVRVARHIVFSLLSQSIARRTFHVYCPALPLECL
jgi:hypothetical protein